MFIELEREGDQELVDAASVLEDIGAELTPAGSGLAAEQIVAGFIERTPCLTIAERAQLLSSVIETRAAASPGTRPAANSSRATSGASRPTTSASRPTTTASRPTTGAGRAPTGGRTPAANGRAGTTANSAGSRSPTTSTSGPRSANTQNAGGRTNFGADLGRFLQQGVGYVQQGMQMAPQVMQAVQGVQGLVAGARGTPASTAPAEPDSGAASAAPPPAAASAPSPSVEPPSVSPAPPQPPAPDAATQAPPVAPSPAMLTMLNQAQVPPLLPAPLGAATPPMDATALLRLLISNPQLQQALSLASVMGPAAPRSLNLTVPGLMSPMAQPRTVSVPLGAAMNALSQLAARSLMELNAYTGENDPDVPEYLLDEAGEFIVDPANPGARASLVAHLFRIDDATTRPTPDVTKRALDDVDAWASELGI
ncbi:MAG: hypothetical protein SF187_04480 [Deltaproteobacteria bacterium]|nr:hypothetical protein [Deltaproteobacteria bacterium]